MNMARRKELRMLSMQLDRAKTDDEIRMCIDILENIRDDEQEYYAELPEELQESICGTDSDNAIYNMGFALDSMYDALDAEGEEREDLLEEAFDLIEDALG